MGANMSFTIQFQRSYQLIDALKPYLITYDEKRLAPAQYNPTICKLKIVGRHTPFY